MCSHIMCVGIYISRNLISSTTVTPFDTFIEGHLVNCAHIDRVGLHIHFIQSMTMINNNNEMLKHGELVVYSFVLMLGVCATGQYKGAVILQECHDPLPTRVQPRYSSL